MHRCYVHKSAWTEKGVLPSPEEIHHLRHVLRLKEGDEIEVFDGLGKHALACLSSATEQTPFTIVKGSVVQNKMPLQITLFQALPKGKRMDLIIEKAAELGVTSVWPLLTERVIVRMDRKQCAAKVERWQRVALSASKQCGTKWAPCVCPISSLSEALASMGRTDLFLVGSLRRNARQLHDVMRDVTTASTGCGTVKTFYRAALLIGPEGDLTDAETDDAVSAGAIPVTFGELVLRVETAALYGMSVLAYELARTR
ncbi:MAG: 16S rRNA (uracil(1498)-N(3))-methyltransferase [Lentisphaerae bacterium]|nr:16S rRNA (uracil(1498)-N(3))-methyltransferase [Lentisphaerota bacterium]